MQIPNKIKLKSMLRKGTLLHGTYRIDGYLSSGGFGNTYVATHVNFHKQYAIKEFFMDGVNERDNNGTTVKVSNDSKVDEFTEQRAKFYKEAQRLHDLDIQNVVRVHDLFDENGTTYYIMDYIDGENLKERLKRTGKPMSEQEVDDVLCQVLEALEQVHSQGLWHMDLKPANIMIDRKGVVKLIDFGASKQFSADKGGALTTSAVAYTSGYAPREQMEGNYQKFGPWTDFYALGATLYNLLTNSKPPMPGDLDDDRTPDKHNTLHRPAGVSDRVWNLMLWLIRTHRLDRPQSVNDIMNYLDGDSEQTMTAQQIASFEQEDDSTTQLINAKQESDEELTIQKATTKQSTKKHSGSEATTVSVEKSNDRAPINKQKRNLKTIIAVVVIGLLLIVCGGYLLNNLSDALFPTPKQDQKVSVNGVSFDMVWVEGGTFTMGATPEQGGDAMSNESPVHKVKLSDFYIGETEVTQKLWQAVMGNNPSEHKGDLNYPVIMCHGKIARRSSPS